MKAIMCSNLILPMTKPYRLSYAELVGPKNLMWFVSHFWNTPFRDSSACIRKHAESLEEEKHECWDMTYWICTLSNNQWRIAEELGTCVKETSFCVALRSGLVRGTCMILDSHASCLTRSWCLFELLQTSMLAKEAGSKAEAASAPVAAGAAAPVEFTGLWLCTPTGVLSEGKASVDNAMAIATELAELDLKEAQATMQSDKKMIDTEVEKMEGGFVAVNTFIKELFYQ